MLSRAMTKFLEFSATVACASDWILLKSNGGCLRLMNIVIFRAVPSAKMMDTT